MYRREQDEDNPDPAVGPEDITVEPTTIKAEIKDN